MRVERHLSLSKSKIGGFLASTTSLKKWGRGEGILSYRFVLILVLAFPSSLWAQDTTPPAVSSATVNETTLVVNFNEGLASVSGLTNSAFTVKKTPSGGSEEEQVLIGTPTVSGEMVTLILSSPVIASDRGTVKVSYTAPTESGAKLRDAVGNDVLDFMDQKVLNLRGGICSRTEVVRDTILDQITRTEFCDEVTSEDLTTVVDLTLSNRGITELRSGDFNGLTNLEILRLNDNPLGSLNQDLFDGLTNLESLTLQNSALTDLHQDLFEGLENLELLWLSGNSLTDLHQDLFEGLENLKTLHLNSNSLTDLHQDLFEGLISLETLILQHNSLTDPHEDLFDGLENLKTLHLNSNALTDLHEDLFEELTSLISISFQNNELTGLHEDLFEGLTSLISISFQNNDLTDLHLDLFEGLTNLETLDLAGNTLTSLHPDLFDGLTSLSRLNLHDNALTSLHPDLFDEVGENLTVRVNNNPLTCISAEILNREGISISSSTLMACPAPTVTSATVDGTTLEVNFNEDLASVSGLTNSAFTVKKTPSGGSEEAQVLSGTPTVSGKKVTLTLSNPVIASDMGTVKVSYTAPMESDAKLRDAEGNAVVNFIDLKVLNLRGGICSRTEAVRDAILSKITRTEFCDEVTDTNLRFVFALNITNDEDITELKSGDFNGLTNLISLNLFGNNLESLHEDLFGDLTRLAILNLNNNALESLHEELFAGLTSLSRLLISNNELTDLHEELFDGLIKLERLTLDDNSLGSLDQDLFDGLTELDTLYLENNSLTSLHEDLFDGLTKLAGLYLNENELTDLHEDLFDGLMNLAILELNNNDLTGLHPDLFDDVEANPFNVNLDGNPLTCVPAKIFNRVGINILPPALIACPDPSVTLSVNPSTIGEEDEATEVTVTATLEVSQTTALPVTVSVGSGTATSGTDFTAVSDFTISIQANTLSSTGTFTLTPTSDTVDEPDETVMITGTSTVENVTVTGTSLTITDDDDAPAITLMLSDNPISEAGGSTTVTATLNHPSSEETTITISVDPTLPATESDYTLSGTTLTIAAGAIESTEIVTITAEVNDVVAPDKIVTVRGSASNNKGIRGPTDVELTITEATPTPPTVSSATVDGTTLVVNFDEDLASVSGLTNSAFTVKKTPSGGSEEAQVLTGTPTVSGKTVTLTLSSPVISSDMGTVKVSYMAPTEPGAKLRDAEGNNVLDFMDLGVLNLRGGICSRTEAVREAILNQITGTEFCYEVTDTNLRFVFALNITNDEDITELKSGDFNGLTNLISLNLFGNNLESLHEDLFGDLTRLAILNLNNNALESLHEELFAGLTSLSRLLISNNELTDLHEELFDGLIKLERLTLDDNSLGSLDQDLFDGLTELDTLYLENNSLTSLHEDLFDGLTKLAGLYLNENELTDLHEDLFDGLMNLAILELNNNDLTGLHPELFDDVEANPFTVSLDGNPLTCVPPEIFNRVGINILPPALIACPDPSVTLSVNPSTIGEEDEATEVTVTATLEVSQTTALPVTVSVGSGTATSGTDFTAVSDFTISIQANTLSSTGTFTLTPTSDTVDEPDETVMITGTSTVENVTVTGTSLTITDEDEAPTVTLNLSSSSIAENAGTTTVTATLDRASSEETTITISVDPTSSATESDYTLSGTTLTIAAGETSSTAAVTITAVDNAVDAPNKTVQVQGMAENTQGITDPEDVELTITDDDEAPVVTLHLSSNSISENAGMTTVTAMLDRASIEETTITISVDPTSSDYMLSGSMLTIAAGETSSTAAVTITAVDNDVDAPDKTVQVQGMATNTQGVTQPTAVELTITDDDEAPVVTLVLSEASISENAGSTTVTATLSHASSTVTAVTISGAAVDPALDSDYMLSGNSLTIPVGQTNSTGTVTITSVDNPVDAPDKSIIVQGVATNLTGITQPADVELTITDDDEAPTATLLLSPASIGEDAQVSTITATLSHASSEETTITISAAAAPGTEFTLSTNTILTIAAGATTSTGTVTITSVDNPADAPDKTVQVQGVATNTQGVTGPMDVTLTITDEDEAPTVTLLLSPESIAENTKISTVTATLSHASSAVTTITVSAAAVSPALESDYTLSGTLLTIAAGTTMSTGTVTITSIDNPVNAPDKTVRVQGVASNTQGVTQPTTVELTITDNEEVPTVTLSLSDMSIPENTGMTTVTASLSPASSAETMITISASAVSPAVDTDYTLSGTTLMIAAGATTSTGTVTITAVDNPVDAPDKTVQVQGLAANDQGVTNPANVDLMITDDEDEPTVTLRLSSNTISEQAGSTTVTAALRHPSSAVTTIVVAVRPNEPATAADYGLGTNQTLTIAAGETESSGLVTITAVDNEVDAPDKTVQVQGTATNVQGITDPAAVELTITDEDAAPTAELILSSPSIREGGERTMVTATLSRPSSEVTTIEVTALPDAPATSSDYMLSGTTLTIMAGATSSTGLVTITSVDNSVDAPDKTIQVQGIATNLQGIVDPTEVEPTTEQGTMGQIGVELTILDDEEAPRATLLLSSSLIGEDGEMTTVTAALNRTSSEPTMIEVTVLPDAPATVSDYILSTNATLTIAAGATMSTGVVTITSVTNDVDAPDKTVQVQGTATNTQGVTGPADVALTITDGTAPPAVTLVLSPASISENAGATMVTATLNRVSSEATTVTVTVLPNAPATAADYMQSGSILTIVAGATQSTGLVTITAVDNLVDAPDKTVQVQGTATNTQGITNPASVGLTLLDDEAVPTVTLMLSPTSIGENAGTSTVTATLSHPSSEETTISISVDPTSPATASDYQLSENLTLTIDAGEIESAGLVTITSVDNLVDAPDKTVQVQGTATNTQGVTSPANVELTITDDEEAPTVTLTLAPASIMENAGIAIVTGALDRPSSAVTTILISALPDAPAAATDFALSGNLRLTIAAGETASTGLVTITAVDNAVDAPDKTVQVQGTATNLQGVTGPEAVELTITDDDLEPVVILSLLPASITENNGFATVTATLDRPSSEGTTVTITTLPDAPATELDYTQEGDLLTIAAGETNSTGLVTITAVDNAVNAPNKTVQVQGIATNGQGLTGPEEVELTILDDDLTPTVTLLLSPTSIGENGGLTTVTAELSRPSSEPTTIEITVLPNAPSTESDYTLRGRTLTIAAGERGSSGVVTIIAVDNATDAPDRTVQVQGEVTRSLGVTSPPAVQLRITDDEPTPTVTLMLDPSTIEENGASTTVTALLSHPSSARTTVVVSALANPPAVASDLMLSQNTILTIAAGGTESTGLMTITAIDNPVDAPDKTVQVQGVATNSQGVSVPADVVLTITDDDEVSPTVSLILAPASIGENDGQTTVTATMEPPSSAVTTIVVSVLPDAPATASDYQISENPTLTIAAGETGSTGRVTITAVDNEVSAPDKTLQVQGTATNPRGVTGPVAVELTITDDEALPTVMLMLDPSTIKENGGETAVTASLDRVSGTVTTIEVTVLPNAPTTASDYQISENSMLTIAAGETESTGLVTITAVDNEVDAPEKTVQVRGIVTSAQGITDPREVELTITDDEEAPAITLVLSPATIEESGESTTVTATLDRASDEETSIELTVLPDAPATTSDYVLSDPLTLTIAAGELTSTGLVTITAVDNEVDAPDKTVQVQGVATNALGTTNPSSVELTITDDDEAPAVTLTLSPASISENAGTTTVTATLNRPSSAMTTIAVTVLPNESATESDYLLSDNPTLTIAAGERTSTELVTITAVDNEVDTPDKTVQVQGTATNTQGVTDPAEVTLTVTDDDESFPVAQDATVTTEEDTPYPFNASDFGYSDPEGDPLASVRIERHPDVGTLTLGGIGFAAGTQISVAQISAGELIFTPVANAYGPAYTSFDFKVSDGTLESPLAARMTIDVTPVNDVATGQPQIMGSMQLGQMLRVSVEEIQDLDGLRRAQAGELGYGYRYQWVRMKEGSPHEPIGEGDTYVPVETDAGASLVVQVAFVDDAGFEESLESPPRQVRSTNRIRTAWMGRLGRTVADQVLRATQCEGRVQRSRRNEVYLAGQPLALASLPNYVHVQKVKPDRHAVLLGTTDPVYRLGHTLTRERLLHGSSFRHGMRDGSGVALWGHGAVSRVQGADGALNLEGRVSSGMVGADWTGDKGGLGVLVAHTRSEGEYAMANDEGTHSAYLTGVYPNGCYALSSGITAWGVVGYGRGSMTVEQVSTPVDLRMVGGGIYGRLGTVRKRGLELGIRSDALLVQMGANGTEELSEDEAQVSRLRLGLQGTLRGIRLGTESTIVPSAELAFRHDGGDAETGFGVDMQVGFRLSELESGLDIEVHAHAVLTHQDRGLQDQGLAGAVTWDPRPHSSEGLQVRVEHTIGAEALGGAERLLRAETIQPQYRAHQTGGLRVQAGYGFALFSRAFTLQPEVSFSGGGPQRRYEMGWNIARAHEHPTKMQLFVGTTGQAQRDRPLQLQHLVRLQLKRQF